MKLITEKAVAFVYSGDWVAECPRPYCGNVEHLFDRINPALPSSPRLRPRPLFVCSHCGLQVDIEWPEPELIKGVMDVLNRRPVPHTRNWFPADLPFALRQRIKEHGQTVDDLLAENAEYGVD